MTDEHTPELGTTPTEDEARSAADAEAARIWPLDREYSPAQLRAVFSVKELDAYNASAFKRGAMWAASRVSTPPSEPECWCSDVAQSYGLTDPGCPRHDAATPPADEDERLRLGRDLMVGIGLTGPAWENRPVNSCPDDDPVGEPRPMEARPVNNLGPLVDYLLGKGWRQAVSTPEPAWEYTVMRDGGYEDDYAGMPTDDLDEAVEYARRWAKDGVQVWRQRPASGWERFDPEGEA